MVLKYLNHQDLPVEWVEEESYFLNYQNGKINYLNFMKIIKTLFYLNQEKMKLLVLLNQD